MNLEDMLKAEEILREQNRKRLEKLDPAIAEIAKDSAPHVVSTWLDENEHLHKKQEPSEPEIQLSDKERQLAREMRISPEAYAKQKKAIEDRKKGNG